VQELVVPNAGHWLMEEAPAATIAAVKDFLGVALAGDSRAIRVRSGRRRR
jgi:hypothetical protein